MDRAANPTLRRALRQRRPRFPARPHHCTGPASALVKRRPSPAIAASTAPFDFALRCIRVFPNGCIHLPPEPDADFRTLTRRVWDAHPDIIPNGAPDPAPHLTLDLASPEVSLTSTRHLLGDAIPVLCRAEALELVWYEAGNCHLIERWPLGSDEER